MDTLSSCLSLKTKKGFRRYQVADQVFLSHYVGGVETICIGGGGLEDKYIFAQLHLHWGNTSQVGSEHMVEGVAFPLELHLVHYNSKYSDIGEAVSHEDGLAVVGVLHHLSAEDNPSLQPLVEAARSVKVAREKTGLARGVTAKGLLPSVPGLFYR